MTVITTDDGSSSVPTPKKITSTELREIKGLIKQDHQILHDGLRERKHQIDEAIQIETNKRQAEAREVIDKAFKNIQARVDTLNDAITKIVEDLNAKGIVAATREYNRNRGESMVGVPLDPKNFQVSFTKQTGIYLDLPTDLYDASRQVQREFNKSLRELDKLQYLTMKDLVTEFVSSEAALEFIQALPTVESLIALPAPVADVDLTALSD